MQQKLIQIKSAMDASKNPSQKVEELLTLFQMSQTPTEKFGNAQFPKMSADIGNQIA